MKAGHTLCSVWAVNGVGPPETSLRKGKGNYAAVVDYGTLLTDGR